MAAGMVAGRLTIVTNDKRPWQRPEENGLVDRQKKISDLEAVADLRSSTMSSGVSTVQAGAGSAGGSRLRRLICLTIMKMMKARMMKFTATVMKLP